MKPSFAQTTKKFTPRLSGFLSCVFVDSHLSSVLQFQVACIQFELSLNRNRLRSHDGDIRDRVAVVEKSAVFPMQASDSKTVNPNNVSSTLKNLDMMFSSQLLKPSTV